MKHRVSQMRYSYVAKPKLTHPSDTLLSQLDLAAGGQAAIDSLPVLVVKFHLVPASTGDGAAYMNPVTIGYHLDDQVLSVSMIKNT